MGSEEEEDQALYFGDRYFFSPFLFFDSQDLTAPAFPLEKGWGEDSGVRKKGARPRFQRGRAQPPGEQRRGATRAPHNGKEDLGGREGSRQAGCRATIPPGNYSGSSDQANRESGRAPATHVGGGRLEDLRGCRRFIVSAQEG